MPDSKFTLTPTDDATKNVVQIDNNTYLCWTQAGFRKALKLFNCGEKMEVRGYPTKYPAMVVLSLAYTGYEYTRCVTYSMNDLEEVLRLNKLHFEQRSDKEIKS